MAIRDNKFARRIQERDKLKSRPSGRDEQPTVDEQLGRLEEDIRRLKVEFDIYFNGAAKRPPYDTKSRVDTVIKRLADDRSLSFAQRYRYNSLVARHNSFLQLWRRTLQDREEGRGVAGARRMAKPEEEAAPPTPQTFSCADPHKDVTTVKRLFETLVEAKKSCGEPTEELSFPRFHRMIASQADKLKDKAGCDSVQFSVGVKDGRVSFKARPEK